MSRTLKFVSLGLLGAVVFFVVLVFVGRVVARPVLAERPQAAEAAPAGDVLAVVGGIEITRDEVAESIASELLRIDRERHEALEQGLENFISQRLLDLESNARGVDQGALLTEVDGRVTAPTDAEVDEFYEARKSQIQQPKEQVADQIRQYLQQLRLQEARGAYLQELRAKYEVKSYLDPLRLAVDVAGSPSLGPEDAPVTIVEFSDFECPYCSRLVPTLERVKREYADKVRLVFRQFPLHSLHPNAQKAAEASLCAHEQDKFWEMHDTLFREQKALGVEQLKQKAVRIELDAERFNECLDTDRYAAKVQDDLEAGTAAGVTGTPAMFINGRFLSGAQPYENIARVIDDELARAGG